MWFFDVSLSVSGFYENLQETEQRDFQVFLKFLLDWYEIRLGEAFEFIASSSWILLNLLIKIQHHETSKS